MKYSLQIERNLSLEELKQKIENGCQFIVFEYCISLFFAVTLRRYSPAILIDSHRSSSKYKRKYNMLSSLFGWWGIPWGPYYTVKSFRANNKGGINVTDDIMLNITEETLKLKEVELEITNQLFLKPSKSNTKALRRALLKNFENDLNIQQLIVGWFINTEEDQAPHYVLGVKLEKDFENYLKPLKDALNTQFRAHTFFEIIDLNEDEDLRKLFEKQGHVLINRIRD